MRIHLLDLLETRLRLIQAWKLAGSRLTAEPILQPIFVTGIPRSGSTFLHELLAADPGNRAPQVWEVMSPVPSHRLDENDCERRIRAVDFQLWWFRRLAPEADAVYPVRATTPHECVAIHSYTLMSQEFLGTCTIPGYRAFLDTTDLRSVYTWERRFLQYLQLGCVNRRWVLKAPDQLDGLDALFAVFPDALVLQIHCNREAVLGSIVRLSKVLNGLFGRVDDYGTLVSKESRALADNVERTTTFRASHPELETRFVDIEYDELMANPLAVVANIYYEFGAELTAAAAQQMHQLASRRSRYPERSSL
jgi:hypothetical protein